MEDIRLNVDDTLSNIEKEIPIITYLSTLSKSQGTMTLTSKKLKLLKKLLKKSF